MSNLKVLLINPNRMKPVVAPLALDYLSVSLATHGIDTKILDLSFSEDVDEDIKCSLKKEHFDAVGVTIRNIDDSYFASQDFCLEKVKDIIELVKIYTDSPIVLGGVGFSIAPIPALNYCNVDLGIWGEGELAFPLLVKTLGIKKEYVKIPGLIFKDRDGYRMNPPFYLDLYQVSLAKRDAVNNRKYYQEGGMVGFETKRGCDQPCCYCADPVAKGRKVRVRSPKDVAFELEGLLEKGISVFHTCDSEFNVPDGHALEVCKEIVKRKLGDRINWYAYATPFRFSEELALWMRRAGCIGIDFGVDSGNEGILKSLGRSYTPDDIRKVARICHRHGFAFMFDLLLGGPGEDRKTLKDTIDLMKEVNPSRVGISLGIRIYPGTPLGRVLGEKMQSSKRGFFGELSAEMLKPIYYLSPELGENIQEFIKELIAEDNRFFFGGSEDIEENYNYNNNSRLVQAIKKGYKGAFWDILRRIEETS